MRFIIAIGFIFLAPTLWAQNLDKLSEKGERTSVSGGFHLNSIGYAQTGLINPSREPFT